MVLVLAGVLLLAFLSSHDLWAPDEPYFAEGAREMVADGRWLVPHVNGVLTTDKPPLFFWLVAILSLSLGAVSELSARLPSVLAAIGTLVLTVRLGRRFYGGRTAALAGAILATSFLFWQEARWCRIDSLLCFLIWAALSAFAAFRSGDLDGRRAGILFWLALGLAGLAKGPVGVMLPLGIAILTLIVDRQPRRWWSFAPLAGPAVFGLCAALWVVPASLWGPEGYSVWGAIREHVIDRGLHGMHHEQPFWYYARELPLMLLPWAALLPGALLIAWRRRSSSDRFLLVAALFVVVFFSLSTEKRNLYVLPAFPAFALLMARLVGFLYGWRDRSGGRATSISPRWVTIGQGAVGALLALAALALPAVALRLEGAPVGPLCLAAALLFAGGAGTLALALRSRPLESVVATAAGVALAYLATVAVVLPALDPVKSGRELAGIVKERTAASRAEGHELVAFRLGNLPRALAFYSGGIYARESRRTAVLAQHLAAAGEVFAVVNRSGLEELPGEILEGIAVLHTARLSRKNVLLISNRQPPSGRARRRGVGGFAPLAFLAGRQSGKKGVGSLRAGSGGTARSCADWREWWVRPGATPIEARRSGG